MSPILVPSSPPPPVVKGVLINPNKDRDSAGLARFNSIDVRTCDPVFSSGNKSTWSEKIGVPLRVSRLPPYSQWKDDGEESRCAVEEKQEAAFLFRSMNATLEEFGLIRGDWFRAAGSALVVRDDDRDLTPQQLEAICYYGGPHTEKRFHEAYTHLAITGLDEEMVKLISLFNPKSFEVFFQEFKAKKVVDDASWATAVSPLWVEKRKSKVMNDGSEDCFMTSRFF